MTPWQQLFEELRRVYGDVSDLLLDSQRLLDQSGWRGAQRKERQIGIERSGAIDQPDQWAPHWIARFFQFDDRPAPHGPLVYVACILSDGGKSDYTLAGGSPIITAGVVHFRSDVGKKWNWWYATAKAWLWAKGGVSDGSWSEYEADWLAKDKIQRVECFAVPLEKVTDRASLEKLVIEPLLTKAGLRKVAPDVDSAA